MTPLPTLIMMRVMLSLLTLCLSVTAAPLAAGQKAPRRISRGTESLTGTYAVHWTRGARCALEILQLPGAKVRFQLYCNRGAPSYNSGVASGVIGVRNGAGVYATAEYGGRCEIRFKFRGNRVTVTQQGSDSDCGFGHNVYCDGIYRVRSRKRPRFESGR